MTSNNLPTHLATYSSCNREHLSYRKEVFFAFLTGEVRIRKGEKRPSFVNEPPDN